MTTITVAGHKIGIDPETLRVVSMDDWGKCWDFAAKGHFTKKSYGPGTYGHTEFFLSNNVDPVTGMTYEEYVESATPMCECEMDYNCSLHRNRVGTWIETRYMGEDSHLPDYAR